MVTAPFTRHRLHVQLLLCIIGKGCRPALGTELQLHAAPVLLLLLLLLGGCLKHCVQVTQAPAGTEGTRRSATRHAH